MSRTIPAHNFGDIYLEYMPCCLHAVERAADWRPPTLQRYSASNFICLFLLLPAIPARAQVPGGGLKGLSLEELGKIEVTTISKQPVQVNKTPAAIYVITDQ